MKAILLALLFLAPTVGLATDAKIVFGEQRGQLALEVKRTDAFTKETKIENKTCTTAFNLHYRPDEVAYLYSYYNCLPTYRFNLRPFQFKLIGENLFELKDGKIDETKPVGKVDAKGRIDIFINYDITRKYLVYRPSSVNCDPWYHHAKEEKITFNRWVRWMFQPNGDGYDVEFEYQIQHPDTKFVDIEGCSNKRSYPWIEKDTSVFFFKGKTTQYKK